ncbi:ribonuclease P protein subunit p40-like [Aethina tumida]|uniref:ribonuclease P protein subunit p40-like n=1 Tax=Aethina tumida TaxID=116153 RepID=UPI0021494F78|nr:ribonuclease P protein subunit p40-like [Aethina tumida]
MQCPEVWNFKEPETIFKSHVVDPDDKSCFSKIRSFHYNHLASVVLPDTLRVPQSLTDTLNTDCDYYKISELNAADLVNEDFLTCFVKSGQLTLLSINTRIDCDSCLCITPLGHLILNVDKETYQALGLEGKVSHFHSKVKSRYSIDDTSDNILDTNSLAYKKYWNPFSHELNLSRILSLMMV